MDARQPIRAAAAAVVSLFAAGCAVTHVGPASSPDADTDFRVGSVVLSSAQHDLASSLARYGMAVRSELHDDRAGALSNYLAAASLDPSNEALQFRVALGLLQEKRNDEAVRLMERAAERAPTPSDRLLIWQALVYRAAERDADALRTYRKAIVVAPTNHIPYLESAALVAKAGDGSGAIRILEGARPHVMTNAEPDLVRALGELYLRDATATAAQGKRSAYLATALETLDTASKRWPDDQALLLMRGNLHAINNDLQTAIGLYNELERRNPDDLNIKEKLAISLMASGNKTGAVAALEAIAAKQPENPKVFYYLGELHEQLGETNSAIASYEKAGAAGGDDPIPFMKAAMLHVTAGRQRDAETVLQRGLSSLPESPRLQEMIAYVLMDQKQFASAVAHFDKASAKLDDPMAGLSKNFRLNYAIAQQLGGNPNEAPRTLRQAMREDRQALDVFISHMMRDAGSNDQVTVAATMERLQVLEPTDARLAMFRGVFLNEAGRFADAVKAFGEAERLASGGAQADRVQTSSFYFWYGTAADRAGDFELAVRNFQRCIAINPANTEARNYLAYSWAERGVNLEDAMVQIRRAMETEPENPAFLDTLGWVHFKMGNYEQARLAIERSLEKIGDNSEVMEHLGDVMHALRRTGDAAQWWKKAWEAGSRTEALREKMKGAGIAPTPSPSTAPAP